MVNTDDCSGSLAWHEQPGFLKLRLSWYKTIAKTGFIDIEHTSPRNGHASHLLRNHALPPAYTPEQEQYYQLAGRYYHVTVWLTGSRTAKCLPARSEEACFCKVCSRIWELHAEGMKQEEIAKKLRTYRSRCQRTISRHAERMLSVEWDDEG